MSTRRVASVVACSLLLITFIAVAQASPTSSAASNDETVVDKVLTFVDSIAVSMGEGIVGLLSSSFDLNLPLILGRVLGYLIILTILVVFASYVRISRIAILGGLALAWGLLIARFVTAALA